MKRPAAERAGRSLRPVGQLTAIPFVLLVGPVLGYFIGDWLDRKWGTEPYLMILFITLGFVAAGREVWGLIKRASRDQEDD
jgi:ATP synthase protein I